ncbi:MAG TPA: hypothetical protein VMV43_00415 [Candidatus Nanopelagicaceae bacterium]|jgi:hypothetical protein|nr:hypothetical protein [Candidatus Nanopelagicaceae bacterium]
MPNDPATVIYNLIQKDPSIIAAAVVQGGDNILYSTDNWDISADVGKVISSWNSMNAQFVMLSGVKYSVLQCTSERLVATSIRGEGHIIGSKDEEHKILIYLEPDGEPMGATMDTARAVSELSSKQSYVDPNSQLGTAGEKIQPNVGANIDPQLKGEVQSFLEWIKDSEGLSGYINYYLQQNNTSIISELSKIYSELRQIFGV